MTTTTRPATVRVAADPTRDHARAAGAFYLVTFAASIPALLMIQSVVSPDLTVASGHDNRLLGAGFLDFVNALAGIGSAVALYPVLKRQNQAMALGFVMSRMTEAAIIMTGVVSLLAVVTMHSDVAGADPAISQALVAVRDWTFLFGPGFMASCNAVLLGTLMYKSGLVPRIIPIMGLVGAPLLLSRTPPPCSVTTSRPPASACSPHCRSPRGSSPSAPGCSSRGSSPPRSQPASPRSTDATDSLRTSRRHDAAHRARGEPHPHVSSRPGVSGTRGHHVLIVRPWQHPPRQRPLPVGPPGRAAARAGATPTGPRT